jgi:hypothetical protein
MTHYCARRRIPIRETADHWREPTLDEILSDSIAEAVMRADSVDRNALDAMLRDIAQHIQASHLTRLAAGRRGGQQAHTIYPRYGA